MINIDNSLFINASKNPQFPAAFLSQLGYTLSMSDEFLPNQIYSVKDGRDEYSFVQNEENYLLVVARDLDTHTPFDIGKENIAEAIQGGRKIFKNIQKMGVQDLPTLFIYLIEDESPLIAIKSDRDVLNEYHFIDLEENEFIEFDLNLLERSNNEFRSIVMGLTDESEIMLALKESATRDLLLNDRDLFGEICEKLGFDINSMENSFMENILYGDRKGGDMISEESEFTPETLDLAEKNPEVENSFRSRIPDFKDEEEEKFVNPFAEESVVNRSPNPFKEELEKEVTPPDANKWERFTDNADF